MRVKRPLWVLLLGCLVATLHAQEQAPALLLQAVHCLAIKNFLSPSDASVLRLGYIVDAKSYPGERVLYAIDYIGTGHSEGFVFTIFLTQRNGREVFNIQNNAKFVVSKSGRSGIRFEDGEDPLGGIWTQDHLISAIHRIQRQREFAVAVDAIRKTNQ